jgi:heme exporter protein D
LIYLTQVKIAAQILLIIFFVIVFFAGLVSATLKFQLLNFNFWEAAFQKHNVYQNLANVSKTSFETQVNKEGGNKNDVKILTDLITTENAKDVVDRNLKNFLNFANGEAPQIIVYLPIDKAPKNLLPANIAGVKSEMTISDLLTKFNFQDWQNLPYQNLFNIGKYAFYVFVSAALLLLLVSVLLILVVEEENRFISLGIAFVLSSGVTFFLVGVATNLNVLFSKSLVENPSIALIILGTIFSPVVTEMAFVWKILGLVILVLGFALFFVKKPTYNNSK